MTESLRTVAHVKVLPRRAILSLIGNVQRSSLILEKVSARASERLAWRVFVTHRLARLTTVDTQAFLCIYRNCLHSSDF